MTTRAERRRREQKLAVMAIAREERKKQRARERHELWRRATHGHATREELARLFPSRYGKV